MKSLSCLSFAAFALIAAPLTGCMHDTDDSADVEDPGPTGQASAFITSVPADVACIRITVSGSTNPSQTFSVTSGASSVSLALSAVPNGSVTFGADAFNAACSAITSAIPTWSADPVQSTVYGGVPVAISLVFHPAAVASATADFEPAIVAIGAGDYATYAVGADGTLYQWGLAVGDQSKVDYYANTQSIGIATTPTKVAGLGAYKVVDVAEGYDYACAVLGNQEARCWGRNDDGQLGNGTTGAWGSYTLVQVGAGVQSLSLSRKHGCARTVSSDVECWGSWLDGQTQLITTSNQHTHDGPGPYSYTAFAAQMGYNTFLTYKSAGDGTVRYDGTIFSSSTSQWTTCNGEVYGLPLLTQIETTDSLYQAQAYGLTALGDVVTFLPPCLAQWQGQTGNAAPILSGWNAQQISARADNACALLADGTAACFGANSHGQHGDGTNANNGSPTVVKGLTGVKQVVTGANHTCALLQDGTMQCWGDNTYGQLGSGDQTFSALPHKVSFPAP